MTCSTCTHWSPKTAGSEMARHHFGCCAHDKPWVFYPPCGTCARHARADEKIIGTRERWLAKGWA